MLDGTGAHAHTLSAECLNRVCEAIPSYLILPPYAAEAMTLWAAHAWALDAAEHSPLLYFTGPGPECGKTLAIEVMSRLVPEPALTGNLSAASIYRKLAVEKPKVPATLLIDDVDSFFRVDSDFRNVLNVGFNRDCAYVERCDQNDYDQVRRLSVWGPKVINGIGMLHTTLTGRSIVIPMKRKLKTERTERFRRTAKASLEELGKAVGRWVMPLVEQLAEAEPPIPEALGDRDADCWEPLFAIADMAGGDWPERARAASLALTAKASKEDVAAMLLSDIRDAFRARGTDRLWSHEIVAVLSDLEHRPWGEWQGDARAKQCRLAKELKPFGIEPKDVRKPDSVGAKKGYQKAWFRDAWRRYLSDDVAL